MRSVLRSKGEMVSGKYILFSRGMGAASKVTIEHCALMEPSSQWVLDVKCRQGDGDWRSLNEAFPESEVEINRYDIKVTMPAVEEELEIAAFGIPGDKDMKRMQMAIFGRQPVKGRNWIISVHLFDDTVMAFENVYKKEKKKGNKLLSPRTGLFVSNGVDDVRIELGDLHPGWKINGSNVQTMKGTDAWNSPENATDFLSCRFEISHVDETKRSFVCALTASHGTDITKAEIMEVFKQKNDSDEISEDGQGLTDVAVTFDSNEGEINDDEINESGETLKHVKVNGRSDILEESRSFRVFLNLDIVTGAYLDRLRDHLDAVCTLKRVKNVTEKLMGSTLALFNDLVKQAAPLTVEKFIKQLEKVYRKDLFATLENNGNLPGSANGPPKFGNG